MKSDKLMAVLCVIWVGVGAGCSEKDALRNVPPADDPVIECGNGLIEDGEECDDGNRASGDGCSESCVVEDGWTCGIEGTPCEQILPDPVENVCGDGVLGGREQCDDGNTEDGDGCSADCEVEFGYDCSGGSCEQAAPGELCGNGIVEDKEVCDDGNQTSGDGCSANCYFVEEGYECSPFGGPCLAAGTSVCGDGIIIGSELCDDGNTVSGDGCSESCMREDGWVCEIPGQPCVTVCGDGIVAGDEACDDGNPFEQDGCSSTCEFEPGFRCELTEDGMTACYRLYCGDGIVSEELGEECDVPEEEGAVYGWSETRKAPYCTSSRLDGTTGFYIGGCELTPYCGDGIVQAEFGEECDLKMVDAEGNAAGGDGSYGGCTADCKLAAACGNGILELGEACDDGNTDDGDGCSADCRGIELGFTCPTAGAACVRLTCGNGVQDPGEICDDGNFVPGDGCYNCRAEAGYTCVWGNPPCPKEICADKGVQCGLISDLYGDGAVMPGFEDCDDGNTVDGDGCSQGAVDPGYICETPGTHCIAAACGDGIAAYGEQCDDGNTASNDGCSNRCRLEAGYACEPGKPCVKGYCGDGIVQAGEECDNDVVAEGTAPAAGDGCSERCKIEPGYKCLTAGGACAEENCGDGVINADPLYTSYEQCDLGASVNGSENAGCSGLCRIESGYHCDAAGQNCAKGTCGDGILDVGEQCDDGNLYGGDGCSPKCIRETIFECIGNDCKPVCGDGITMWMAGEECDDGNLVSGDGCSAQCKVEKGFTCTDFKSAKLPETINVPVVYRDFREFGAAGTGDGYMTQAVVDNINKDPVCRDSAKTKAAVGRGFQDFGCTYGGSGCKGMVENELDADGKPVIRAAHTGNWGASKCSNGPAIFAHISCPGSMYYWYRSIPGVNNTFNTTLKLSLIDEAQKMYQFDSNSPDGAVGFNGKPIPPGAFCPVNGVGYAEGRSGNRGAFTTEIHTYFQYQGGEKLDFRGDDDVWVFINNKLFVDLGGMQATNEASGQLAVKEYEVGKDAEGNAINRKYDPKFDVYEGGIYDIKLFHAERCFGASNFKLSLSGFLNTGKAECASVCGDGIVAADEQCDNKDHVDDDTAKFLGCVNCEKQNVCGNGILEPGEACDTGHMCQGVSSPICAELGITYTPDEACNPVTCKYDSCGNGTLESYEQCDCKDGNCLFKPEFDAATSLCMQDTCKVAICGDGIINAELGEECDNGIANGDNAECTKQCTTAKCGDGIVQPFLGEVCDLGSDAEGNSLNTGAHGTNGKPGCSMDCRFKTPYCGDGKIQKGDGETCDDGAANDDNKYNGCTTSCQLGPHCGDGIIQKEAGESCDEGELNGTDGVNCSVTCSVSIN